MIPDSVFQINGTYYTVDKDERVCMSTNGNDWQANDVPTAYQVAMMANAELTKQKKELRARFQRRVIEIDGYTLSCDDGDLRIKKNGLESGGYGLEVGSLLFATKEDDGILLGYNRPNAGISLILITEHKITLLTTSD